MEREGKDGETEHVYDVASFKGAFRKGQFCLIPIKFAVEACYWGPTAGKIVRFGRNDGKSLIVIGLWDEWVDRRTREITKTVTLLTDGPYRYFFDKGHDRSIISVDPQAGRELLLSPSSSYTDNFSIIRSSRIDHEWMWEPEREMKNGWQKRCPSKEEMADVEKTVWSWFQRGKRQLVVYSWRDPALIARRFTHINIFAY